MKTFKQFIKTQDPITIVAEKIFQLNSKNLTGEISEFAIVLYKNKLGDIITGSPIVGESNVEVAIKTYRKYGIPVAIVHSHPDQSAEASSWDVELGEQINKETGQEFRIYTIGLDLDSELLTMTEERFNNENV